MSSASKNSLWRFVFSSRWFVAIGLVIVFFLATACARAFYQNYQVQQEIQRLQDEAARLESKKIETLETLKYVKSPAFVEEKARTELNLVKEGENVLVLPGGQPVATRRQGDESVIESNKQSNLQKWWKYFFDHR